VRFDLPPLLTATDAEAAIGAVLAAVAAGFVSPTEGDKIVSIIQTKAEATHMRAVEERLERLEAVQPVTVTSYKRVSSSHIFCCKRIAMNHTILRRLAALESRQAPQNDTGSIESVAPPTRHHPRASRGAAWIPAVRRKRRRSDREGACGGGPMSTASILARLSRLEAARPVERKPVSPWPMVFHKLIVFHLSGWTKASMFSPAEHYAMGAGWCTAENRSTMAMQVAIGTDAYQERHSAAVAKMFAARRVDIDSDGMPEVLGALIAEAEAGGMTFPELAADAA
jgi:hypothetical protein